MVSVRKHWSQIQHNIIPSNPDEIDWNIKQKSVLRLRCRFCFFCSLNRSNLKPAHSFFGPFFSILDRCLCFKCLSPAFDREVFFSFAFFSSFFQNKTKKKKYCFGRGVHVALNNNNVLTSQVSDRRYTSLAYGRQRFMWLCVFFFFNSLACFIVLLPYAHM